MGTIDFTESYRKRPIWRITKTCFRTQKPTNSCGITLLFRVINVDMSSTTLRVTYVTTGHLGHGEYFA